MRRFLFGVGLFFWLFMPCFAVKPQFFIRLEVDQLPTGLELRIFSSMELLDRFVASDRPRPEFAEAAELVDLEERSLALIRDRVVFSLNGQTVAPRFIERRTEVAEDTGAEEGLTFMQGGFHILRFAYSCPEDAALESVEIQWPLFVADVVESAEDLISTQRYKEEVVAHIRTTDEPYAGGLTGGKSIVTNHQATARLHVFQKSDPVYTWSRRAALETTLGSQLIVTDPPLRKPLGFAALLGVFGFALLYRARRYRYALMLLPLVIACAIYAWSAKPRIPSAQRTETMSALLETIYHAFDHEDERDVLAQLSRCIHGPMLQKVYQEFYQSLAQRRDTETLMQVASVEVLNASDKSDGRIECSWRVNGYIGHWSHLHKKINRQSAIYRITPIDGHWKITDSHIVDQQAELDETTRWK